MNWIRENKFLAGFIAVMVIGAGVLGYLLYDAWGAYSDVSDQYNAQADSLHQLQTRVPYPDRTNLAKYQTERDDLLDATHDLASSLSKLELPVIEMSPSDFQDRLRDTLAAVVAAAAKNGVKLPERFSMDFERYQSAPPSAEAAAPLGRELAALKIVMDILINEHVETVISLQRAQLPEEGGGGGGRQERERGGGRFGRGGGGGGGGESVVTGGLVEKIPFEVQFTANQPSFQKVLNDLASSTTQFFITRTLLIQNSDPRPVAKSTVSVAAPAQQPAVAAPGAAPSAHSPGGGYLKFIVGTEKLEVAMQVDIVAFNPPDRSARKGAGQPH